MSIRPPNLRNLPIILANFLHRFPNKSEIPYSPFHVRLNEATGRWIPPMYSLRRQADLKKAAEQHGLLDLLPPFPEKEQGILRKRPFKLHKWERTKEARVEKVQKALEEMPKTIEKWKADKETAKAKEKSALPF